MLVDIGDGVFYRGDFFGVFIGNFDVKRLLESHDQLDGIQRIRAQIVHEGSRGRHFPLVHTELLHDDLLYAFFNAGHSDCLRSICEFLLPGSPLKALPLRPSLHILCTAMRTVNFRMPNLRHNAALAAVTLRFPLRLTHVHAAIDIEHWPVM